jgi:hypothetical protein
MFITQVDPLNKAVQKHYQVSIGVFKQKNDEIFFIVILVKVCVDKPVELTIAAKESS